MAGSVVVVSSPPQNLVVWPGFQPTDPMDIAVNMCMHSKHVGGWREEKTIV